MQFRVPATSSMEHALEIFYGVRKFLHSKGFQLFFTAISKIEYAGNSHKETVEVSEASMMNGETVMLIFETENEFLVCTPSRGIAEGEPIIIDRSQTIQVTYFDDLPVE